MRWITTTLLLPCLLLLLIQMRPVVAAPSQNDSIFGARVLELTNRARQQAGLGSLALSSELNNAAQSYSQVLATSGCFEHTCGPVPNFVDRAGQSGYTGWSSLGENIAVGYATPEAVIAGWMNSPGHRANLLSPKFTEMGIGLVSGIGQFGTYWTQEFGSRPEVTRALPPDTSADDNVAGGATGDDNGSGG